jgi:hypothetical protein
MKWRILGRILVFGLILFIGFFIWYKIISYAIR